MRNKRAFTLIELIVAVAILSLVFSLASSFIWLSLQLATRSKDVSARVAGIRNIIEILDTDLRSISSFEYNDNADFALENEGKSISFISAAAPGDFKSDYNLPILRITYFLKKEDNETLLYKRIESPFNDFNEETAVFKGDFEFSVLVFEKNDAERANLIEKNHYSKDSAKNEELMAVKIKCLKNETEIERIVFLPLGREL